MLRFSRKLKASLFVTVLILSFLYLSYSSTKSSTPTWYQRAILRVISPVIHSANHVFGFFEGTFQHYIQLWGVQQENLRLQGELQNLYSELLQVKEENHQWRLRMQLSEQFSSKFPQGKLATVLGYDPIPSNQTITIQLGSEDGVQEDQAVLAQGSVVGRILKVFPRASQVLLISDVHSNVDVLDESTRARGTLVGMSKQVGLNRDRWLTKAEHLSGQDEIRIGDRLITSGQDKIFPSGLLVGEVIEIKKDPNGLFWEAQVEPVVELTKLEEVFVVIGDRGSDIGHRTSNIEYSQPAGPSGASN